MQRLEDRHEQRGEWLNEKFEAVGKDTAETLRKVIVIEVQLNVIKWVGGAVAAIFLSWIGGQLLNLFNIRVTPGGDLKPAAYQPVARTASTYTGNASERQVWLRDKDPLMFR